MKKLIPILMAALGVLGAERASAANYQGVIASVFAINNLAYVFINNGTFDGSSSSCRTGAGMVYSFDPTTAFGRSLLSVVLTAKSTGALVYAVGSPSCAASSPYGAGGTGETLTGMDVKGN